MKQREEPDTTPRSSVEQRKLRSRDAARSRRSQETEVFYELAHTLPLPRRVCSHLDKSAIMRVALSVLRLQNVLRPGSEQQRGGEPERDDPERDDPERDDPVDACCPQALHGFLLLLTEEGDVIYLTESVSRHTGITQLELLGQSIYDFVHQCDQEELRELLSARPGKKLSEQPREIDFFLRLKSTLTSRGRTVNIKSAAWKVFHCSGLLRALGGPAAPPAGRVLTLLCEPVPQPASVEFPLDTCTLLTRHSLDLSFTHCEGRVTELVGYKPEDLIGRSAFQFHHALDSEHVRESVHTLLSKGQVITGQYRFLASRGGFVWVETQASVLYSSRTSQPDAVVCLNFILSGVQQEDVVFSVEQTRSSRPAAGSSPEACELTEPLCSQTEDAAGRPEAGDAADSDDGVAPLTGGLVELSFSSPPVPLSVPEHPEDLCSPQLRQLLSPIFCPLTPPPSSSASSAEEQQEEQQEEQEEQQEEQEEQQEEVSSVLKFFSVCEQLGDTQQQEEVLDLDMLAPYISMDDDFQLSVSSSLTEEAPPTSCEPPAEAPAGAASRKRTLSPDKDTLMSPDKRQKRDPSAEEELLLIHELLGCLQEADQSDVLLQPGGRSQLPTGPCGAAAVMSDPVSTAT